MLLLLCCTVGRINTYGSINIINSLLSRRRRRLFPLMYVYQKAEQLVAAKVHTQYEDLPRGFILSAQLHTLLFLYSNTFFCRLTSSHTAEHIKKRERTRAWNNPQIACKVIRLLVKNLSFTIKMAPSLGRERSKSPRAEYWFALRHKI